MNQNNHTRSNQRGAVSILVAVSLIMIFGFAALAVDVGRHVMVGNEVQNAVDAGALAGARALYIIESDNTTTFTPLAATEAAEQVTQANAANEVNIALDNMTVQRGHWTFDYENNGPGTFDNNSTLIAYEFDEDDTTESLNIEPEWINAVRVEASTGEPVLNYFARIFGIDGFNTTRDAVAYIGFAGYIPPEGIDLPIAICDGTMEEMNCTTGRMFPSPTETAVWTDYTQASTGNCGTASTTDIGDLASGCVGNPDGVPVGENSLSTTGGTLGTDMFEEFEKCCFKDLTSKTGLDCTDLLSGSNSAVLEAIDNQTARIKNVTLPVVRCGSGTDNCRDVTGFINMDIVWVTGQINISGSNAYEQAPRQILDVNEDGEEGTPDDDEVYQAWLDNSTNGQDRWNSFVDEFDGFNLKNADGNPAEYADRTIYFRPSCDITIPTGPPGGEYYGIISQIPVLVE